MQKAETRFISKRLRRWRLRRRFSGGGVPVVFIIVAGAVFRFSFLGFHLIFLSGHKIKASLCVSRGYIYSFIRSISDFDVNFTGPQTIHSVSSCFGGPNYAYLPDTFAVSRSLSSHVYSNWRTKTIWKRRDIREAPTQWLGGCSKFELRSFGLSSLRSALSFDSEFENENAWQSGFFSQCGFAKRQLWAHNKKNPLIGFCLFKSIFELNFALFGAVAVVSKVLPAGMMELPGNLLPYSLINKNFF